MGIFITRMFVFLMTHFLRRKQREADEPRRLAMQQENEQLGKVILEVQQEKAVVAREVDQRKKVGE